MLASLFLGTRVAYQIPPHQNHRMWQPTGSHDNRPRPELYLHLQGLEHRSWIEAGFVLFWLRNGLTDHLVGCDLQAITGQLF